jgi:hypothetical protein
MKTITFIIILGILAIIFIPKLINKYSVKLLKECPDEMIINKMPSIDDSNTDNSYYIKDGKRREISEYDAVWVNMNCKLKVQEVY